MVDRHDARFSLRASEVTYLCSFYFFPQEGERKHNRPSEQKSDFFIKKILQETKWLPHRTAPSASKIAALG